MDRARSGATGIQLPEFMSPAPPLIPPHLKESMVEWVRGFIVVDDPPGQYPNGSVAKEIERELALAKPLQRHGNSEWPPVEDLLRRIRQDDDLGLRVVAYLLRIHAGGHEAQEMGEILAAPGSRWDVEIEDNSIGSHRLVLRVPGPVQDALGHLAAGSAHDHLDVALSEATGVQGDRSKAMGEAVKAVEAAAKPVVTPDDDQGATLGTMISALRAKPGKWEVVLDRDSVERVADRAEVLWRSHRDRHGTDAEREPITEDEALVAVYLAIELVATFQRGLSRQPK
jgi:hypothetical protein